MSKRDSNQRPIEPGCLLIAAMLAAGVAHAGTEDRSAVAEIDAGHFAEEPGYRIFSQGVKLNQGTLAIDAQTARVAFDDDGEMVSVELTGTPVVWQETLDSGEQLHARALRIDYDLAAGKVVLREQVRVERGTDEITGEQIRYDLTTERIDAGGDGGRVQMRITPRRSEDAGDS